MHDSPIYSLLSLKAELEFWPWTYPFTEILSLEAESDLDTLSSMVHRDIPPGVSLGVTRAEEGGEAPRGIPVAIWLVWVGIKSCTLCMKKWKYASYL